MIKTTSSLVTIVHPVKGVIATHERAIHPGSKITNPDHIPERAKAYSMWSSDTFLATASRIGPHTSEMIKIILASREFEVQSYRS